LLYEVFRALLEGILGLLASHGFFRLTNQGRFSYGHAQMVDDIFGVVTALNYLRTLVGIRVLC
jgi:hypothetical protein